MKLTVKQSNFVKEYAKSGNATSSVIKAGYDVKNKAVARAVGSENLTKPNIQEALKMGMTKHKLNIDRALNNISLALDADKQTITGEWLADYSTRLKATEMTLKLLDKTTEEKPVQENPQLIEALENDNIDEIQLVRLLKK